LITPYVVTMLEFLLQGLALQARECDLRMNLCTLFKTLREHAAD